MRLYFFLLDWGTVPRALNQPSCSQTCNHSNKQTYTWIHANKHTHTGTLMWSWIICLHVRIFTLCIVHECMLVYNRPISGSVTITKTHKARFIPFCEAECLLTPPCLPRCSCAKVFIYCAVITVITLWLWPTNPAVHSERKKAWRRKCSARETDSVVVWFPTEPKEDGARADGSLGSWILAGINASACGFVFSWRGTKPN